MDTDTAGDVQHPSGDKVPSGASPWITCTPDVIYAGKNIDAPIHALEISQSNPSSAAAELKYRGFDGVENAQEHLMEIIQKAVTLGSSVKDSIQLICFSELPDDHTSFGNMVRLIHPIWIDDPGNLSNGMASLRKNGGGVESTEQRPPLVNTSGGPPNVTYSMHVPGLVASFFAYYTPNNTTICLTQVMTGALGSHLMLSDLIIPSVPLHIPRMPSHPLTGLMIIFNRLIFFKRRTSDTLPIENVLRSAGLHNYTNWERRDAMSLPPQELVSYTAKMVATSTGLLARTGELRAMIDGLKYLREENLKIKRWCDESGKTLAYQHINEWAEYLELQAKSLQIYEESLAATASVVVQGLQNIIGQKNQEETRRIAEESRGIALESKRLTEESRKIAEASWKDTTSVTAVTLITMLFLPATFVAVSGAQSNPSPSTRY